MPQPPAFSHAVGASSGVQTHWLLASQVSLALVQVPQVIIRI